MGVNSLPKTVTRQRRDCDLNPGPSAPESGQHASHSATEPPKKNSNYATESARRQSVIADFTPGVQFDDSQIVLTCIVCFE